MVQMNSTMKELLNKYENEKSLTIIPETEVHPFKTIKTIKALKNF